jgi:gluconate 2-dehydrogenase gamma chain
MIMRPPVPSSPPAAAAVAPPTPKTAYLFFNNEEAVFIEPAVARLIPKDDQWAVHATLP